MAKQESTTQPNARCWVWFRGGLNEDSHWRGGWYGAESVLGGVRIEKMGVRSWNLQQSIDSGEVNDDAARPCLRANILDTYGHERPCMAHPSPRGA